MRELVVGIQDWEYGLPGEWSYRQAGNMITLHPFPSSDDLHAAYGRDYHGYAAPSRLHRLHTAWMARQLRRWLPPQARVLDVGCGTGMLLQQLQTIGGHGEGLDFNEYAVLQAASLGIPVTCGTLESFTGRGYDLVVMNHYLEHTLDPLATLQCARALLNPLQHLVGEVPNFGAIERRVFGRYWGGHHAPRHTFQFDAATLTALLRQAGFIEIRVGCTTNPVHLALSIQNWLQAWWPIRLTSGRAWYFPALLLACWPVTALLALCRTAGVLWFRGRQP